jgi:hypothetical protein
MVEIDKKNLKIEKKLNFLVFDERMEKEVLNRLGQDWDSFDLSFGRKL